MFSKLSRYFQVPNTAVADARGRVLAAKDIRPLPDVTGAFQHTVDSGDRLDNLAYSFYSQPLQYWHICDANPQFLSPLELLDKEPVTTTRFPVSVAAGDPPWAAVLSALAARVGVEDVTVEEDVNLVEQRQTVDNQPVMVVVKQFSRALLVRYNRLTLAAAAAPTDVIKTLSDIITAAGFAVAAPSDSGQLGKPIIIPPPVSG